MAKKRRQDMRRWLRRLLSIKLTLIPDLQDEMALLAERVGPGTHRLAEMPGVKVCISEAVARRWPGRWRWYTDWRGVAEDLAGRLGLTEEQLKNVLQAHQKRSVIDGRAKRTSGMAVSVQKDKVVAPKQEPW